MSYSLAVLLLLALGACGTSGEAPPAAAGTSFDPAPREVRVEAADGLSLAGTLYPAPAPGPHPGVLLLHMLGSRRQSWTSFAAVLNEAGYTALALDLRGHGDTGGKVDWNKAPDDVLRAWRFMSALPEVDPGRTALVGASIGSNLALVAGAAEPRIQTVVLLSPGLDYRGVSTPGAVARYGARPLLIVASSEDRYAASSSATLSELAQSEESQLQLYEGAGHGTTMLRLKPELKKRIVDWLNQHLAAAAAAPVADVRSVRVQGEAGAYIFSVEVSSPDLGCRQYADWWEVLGEKGRLLYRRILLHSHVDEQPFVRSGGPVAVAPDQVVWVRAHMHSGGYGAAFKGTARKGFKAAALGADFAPGVEKLEPLPAGCAF